MESPFEFIPLAIIGALTGYIGAMFESLGDYAATCAVSNEKFKVKHINRGIAAEGGGDVRGFSVSVGYVLTPLMADQIADTAASRGLSETEVVEDVMLGPARTKTMMTPAEVANLFVFGFSTHATHLNGGDLLFDGGYTTTYE